MNRVRIYLPTGSTMHYTDEAIADLREREVGTSLPIKDPEQRVIGHGRVVGADFDEHGPYLDLEVDDALAALMNGGDKIDTIMGLQGFSLKGTCPTCGATHPASNVQEIIHDGGGRGFHRCRDPYHGRAR